TFSIAPQSLTVFGFPGASPAQNLFQITTLNGNVNWSASVKLLNGSNWLAVSPLSGLVSDAQPSRLSSRIDFGALGSSLGVFQAAMTVSDTASGYSVTVPITATVSANPGRLVLSQSSFVFTVAGGGSAPPERALSIFNAGQGTIPWSIPSSAVPSWLNLS